MTNITDRKKDILNEFKGEIQRARTRGGDVILAKGIELDKFNERITRG